MTKFSERSTVRKTHQRSWDRTVLAQGEQEAGLEMVSPTLGRGNLLKGLRQEGATCQTAVGNLCLHSERPLPTNIIFPVKFTCFHAECEVSLSLEGRDLWFVHGYLPHIGHSA